MTKLAIVLFCLASLIYTSTCEDYRCPMHFFGGPAKHENGSLIDCGKGEHCPMWHFCSGPHQDGTSVCCHIIGP